MASSFSSKPHTEEEPPLKKLKANEESSIPNNNSTAVPQSTELSLEAKKKIEHSRIAALTRRYLAQLKDESWKNTLKDGETYL